MIKDHPQLFPASEIPTRPSSRDAALIAIAAKDMARILCESGAMGRNYDLDGIAKDLAKCPDQHRNDGFKFALYLEKRCQWNCNFQIAKHLDDFSSELDRVVSKAEALWATENGGLA
jgi:hypothetical protein